MHADPGRLRCVMGWLVRSSLRVRRQRWRRSEWYVAVSVEYLCEPNRFGYSDVHGRELEHVGELQ